MSGQYGADFSGFATTLSAADTDRTLAWAIAVGSTAAPNPARQLRWLTRQQTHDLTEGLQTGEVMLWMASIRDRQAEADIHRDGLDLAHASAMLDTAESNRALRFADSADRRSFIASRAGARLLLGSALKQRPDSLRFSPSTLGKPTLSPEMPLLDFSISHAREAVAVAVAREPIGVDLEPLRELDDIDAMSDLVLARQERALLARAPEALRSKLFLRYWTLKEALLKAAGFGFSIPPNTIVIDAGTIPTMVSGPAILEADTQWQFISPALDSQLADWINDVT